MKQIKDIPLNVQWYEGMLIGPQHFQQSNNRQESLLHYHLNATRPYYWGVRNYKFDKALLAGGVFSIDEIEAIMPDGLEVQYISKFEDALSIDLNAYFEDLDEEEKDKVQTINLIVPSYHSDNISIKGDQARFISIQGEDVTDENTGENALQIPRLKPTLRLQITDAIASKYVGFPLAKVEYKDANFILVDYLPPAITTDPLPELLEMGKDIVRKLREKNAFLVDKVYASSSASGAAIVWEIKDMIKSLVSALPQLECVLKTDNLHPLSLYQSLLMVVGQLIPLSKNMLPPSWVGYEHENILNKFKQVHEYIIRVTDQGIQEKYSTIPFKFNKAKIDFRIHLKKEWMSEKIIIGVKGQAGMDREQIEKWMETCSICSESQIETMLARRVPGIKRKPTEGNEELIPMGGLYLFSLDTNPEFILPDEELVISNRNADLKTKSKMSNFVLYIKNKPVTEATLN